jgi:hypothetical protein
MSTPRRVAAFVVAAALSLIATPPAFGANGVYGGTTSAREAIVLTSDAKAKKLRTAVIAWDAECADGMSFPFATELRAVAAEPGFAPGPEDLVVSRNAKGRFAGTHVVAWDLGAEIAGIAVELSGTMRADRASGKLTANVSIFDKATGDEKTSCATGKLSWSASRSAGRIFGGKTAQGEPVVVRLDAKRKMVSDLLVGWESDSCQPPDRYFRFGERFSRLKLRARRFGDTHDESYTTDDGGKLVYGYELAGSVARRSVSGSLQVTVTGTDAAGTPNLSCDSGTVRWKAATG